MTIRVQNGKAEAIDPRPLHDDKGAINGLPLASDVISSTNEVAFSDTLHRLKGIIAGWIRKGSLRMVKEVTGCAMSMARS